MQHRAMSLMSKKMAAALALEGEFSEEGLAAMAGEGDEQMALAKSMSEKIDDADMQRSWSKVKSLTEKKKPIKKKVDPNAGRPGCGRQAGRAGHSRRGSTVARTYDPGTSEETSPGISHARHHLAGRTLR